MQSCVTVEKGSVLLPQVLKSRALGAMSQRCARLKHCRWAANWFWSIKWHIWFTLRWVRLFGSLTFHWVGPFSHIFPYRDDRHSHALGQIDSLRKPLLWRMCISEKIEFDELGPRKSEESKNVFESASSRAFHDRWSCVLERVEKYLWKSELSGFSRQLILCTLWHVYHKI